MTKSELRENVEMALLAAGLVVSMSLSLTLLATSTNHALQWREVVLQLAAGTVVGAFGLGLFYVFTHRVVELERRSNSEEETNGG